MIVMTIRDDKVILIFDDDTTRVVASKEDFDNLIVGIDSTVFCSSAMDFPEDYTSNADTIALAKAIR